MPLADPHGLMGCQLGGGAGWVGGEALWPPSGLGTPFTATGTMAHLSLHSSLANAQLIAQPTNSAKLRVL